MGVVQKKGAISQATKKGHEQRNISSRLQRHIASQPQVIDSENKEEKRDGSGVESSSQKKMSRIDEFESCVERSCWEGSLPQIASVQGGSEVDTSDTEGLVSNEGVTSAYSDILASVSLPKGKTVLAASIPSLTPFSSSAPAQILEDKGLDSKRGKSSNVMTPAAMESLEKCGKKERNPKLISSVHNPATKAQQLYFVPTGFVSMTTTTVTTSISSPPLMSTPGMKMLTFNQASHRIFGDDSGKSILSIPQVSYSSPAAIENESASVHPGNPVLPKITAVVTQPNDASSSENVIIGQVNDTSLQYAGSTPKRTERSVVPVVQIAAGVQKGLCLPPSKSLSSQMMMKKPPTGRDQQDVPLKKMLLVPSTTDSGEMVLLPMPLSFSNASIASDADDRAGIVNPSSSNQLLLLDDKLGNSNSASEMMRSSKSLSLSSEKHLPTTPASPPLVKIKSQDATKEKKKDNSDDVIVLDSSLHTLAISKVKNLSKGSGKSLSSSSPSNGNIKEAATTIVSACSTISNTLPQTAASSVRSADLSSPSVNTASSSAIDSTRPSIKAYSQEVFNKENDMDALNSGTRSNDSPVIEYEGVKASEEMAKQKTGVEASSLRKEAKGESSSNSGTDEIQEVEVTAPLIKKGGYRWSAVDLSLCFSSVKLEWLVGTMKKNVLINIYRMSQKTHSPVTLSVKNGTSMSVVYGMARKSYFDPVEQKYLPVLILGSFVKAVMSSNSTPNSLLFKSNAIKYFMKEDTGELSSCTYDERGCNLIRLASKKKTSSGEMFGIGETISLHSVRDPKYIESSQTKVAFKESDPSKVPQSNNCGCITAGNFICHEHKNVASSEQSSVPTPSAATLQEKSSTSNLESSEISPAVRETSVVVESVKDTSFNQRTKNNVSQSEGGGVVQMEKTSSGNGESPCVSSLSEDSKAHSVPRVPISSAAQDCEILCVKSPSKISNPISSQPSLPPPLPQENLTENTTLKEQSGDDNEEVDVEGVCDERLIISNMRDQITEINQNLAVTGERH